MRINAADGVTARAAREAVERPRHPWPVSHLARQRQRLVEEFRRQLEQGMWAAVPVTGESGRREAEMVRAFEEIPRTTDRVIFFPRAAGGAC